jgi:maltooligosyltrehalose trehalohydrolase
MAAGAASSCPRHGPAAVTAFASTAASWCQTRRRGSSRTTVHGLSLVVDPASYGWSDDTWKGRPWEEAVLYELHVGTATPEGTYAGLERRLENLRDLGVTAIELMPINDFAGRRNWGYDGVLPYAPDATYGTPDELKRLVDRAHALGLMVFLDVVYNHFGPAGNYLHAYAKSFFTERHQTPWGAGINVDGESGGAVRDFFVHNALYWLEEFHIDGLRFDAVHAIQDDSGEHIVGEIARRVRETMPERHVHLVLENEKNEARWLTRDDKQAPRLHTAQWNDDIHHCWHVLLTGESDAYYEDFVESRGEACPLPRRGLRLPGRAVPPHGTSTRRALRTPAAVGLRGVPAKPRPDRQPRHGRAPLGACAPR